MALSEEGIILRGNDAQSLLDNPMFKTVFDEITSMAQKEWIETAKGETSDREELYFLCKAVSLVRDKLLNEVAHSNYVKQTQEEQE